MLKQEKERVVAEIVERLRTSETLLVADYRGLTHAELDRVRTELLKLGARFAVVKNTLTRRAAETAGIDTLEEFLSGPTAIAFVIEGDAAGVAKVLSDTARETRRLTLKGGVMNGRVVGGEAVRELATLPPADVLRGQLLGAIVGPVSSIVGLFTAPLRDLVGVLDARIRQLDEGAGPAPPDEPAAEEPAAEEPPADAEAAAAPPEEPAADEQPADAEAAAAPPEQPETEEPPAAAEAEPDPAADEAEAEPAEEAEGEPDEPETQETDEPDTEASSEPQTQEEES